MPKCTCHTSPCATRSRKMTQKNVHWFQGQSGSDHKLLPYYFAVVKISTFIYASYICRVLYRLCTLQPAFLLLPGFLCHLIWNYSLRLLKLHCTIELANLLGSLKCWGSVCFTSLRVYDNI